jgi:hypothetical protein
MRTAALLALLASGCAGVSARLFDASAHAPKTVSITPLILDSFTSREARHQRSVGNQESLLLADSVRAVGASVVERKRADYALSGTVLRATVDDRVEFAFNASPLTSYGTHFRYVHTELDLQLSDSSGRLVASAHAATDEGDVEALGRTMRATLRKLLAAFPRVIHSWDL